MFFLFFFWVFVSSSFHFIISSSLYQSCPGLFLVRHPQIVNFFFVVKRRDDLMIQVIPNADQLQRHGVVDIVVFSAKVSLATEGERGSWVVCHQVELPVTVRLVFAKGSCRARGCSHVCDG